MTLASTSKAQLAYIEEVTPGTTPVAGTPSRLRITGESLGYKISNESSKEINDTRQVSDRVQTGATADGDVNIELSYQEFDPFIEAILCDTFTTFGTGGQTTLTCTINKTLNTITDDGIDGFTGLVAGQWFSLIGAGAGANAAAGPFRIASRTNDQLTVDSDTPFVADITSASMIVSSSRLQTGTAALRYFSMQKYFSDVTQYFIFRGMSPSKLSLNLATGALLTGSIGFMGLNSNRSGSTMLPGAPADSQAYGIMNSVTGVGQILLDSAPIANTFIKSATINIDAKLRGQSAIGSLGSVGIGAGTFEIGGTVEMYLASAAMYDQALANTNVSLQIPISDVDGNGYVFIFPNVKLDVPTVTAGSMDSDVMLSMPFTAVAPSSSDHMLIVDRFGASVA